MEWAIALAALVSMALVNWYFFWSHGTSAVAARGASGIREITVTVKGGYEPAVLRIPRGEPVRLIFDRQETSGCSEEVVMPDFNIRRFLPPFEKTAIELTADQTGSYEFTCGMGMLRGRVVVEEQES